MNEDQFNEWWDADKLTQTNPYPDDSPVYWAWEGWHARNLSDELSDPGRLRKRVMAQRAELRRLNKIIGPRWAAFSAGLEAAKVTELRGKMIKAFGHPSVYKAENEE